MAEEHMRAKARSRVVVGFGEPPCALEVRIVETGFEEQSDVRLRYVEEIAAMLLHQAGKPGHRRMQFEEFVDGPGQEHVDKWPQRTDFLLPARHIVEC
jgi:hypothetical protein